jgi:hypothetical protein
MIWHSLINKKAGEGWDPYVQHADNSYQWSWSNAPSYKSGALSECWYGLPACLVQL